MRIVPFLFLFSRLTEDDCLLAPEEQAQRGGDLRVYGHAGAPR